MAQLKLGKLPAAPKPTDFRFAEFTAAISLPNVPSRFGHGTAFSDWKMLGNDQYGDCVWAGSAHEHMLFNKVVQHQDVPFDDQCVLGDYSAVTGFNPADPNTDKGTDVHVALDYRRKTGIADSNGTRHLIGAYVALDPKNWDHLEQAAYIFGAVGIGFQFPASAMDQFNNGEIWDVVPGSAIQGGHYVPVVGSVRLGAASDGDHVGEAPALHAGVLRAVQRRVVGVRHARGAPQRRRVPRLRPDQAEPVPGRAEQLRTRPLPTWPTSTKRGGEPCSTTRTRPVPTRP